MIVVGVVGDGCRKREENHGLESVAMCARPQTTMTKRIRKPRMASVRERVPGVRCGGI